MPVFSIIALHASPADGIRAQEALQRMESSLGSDLKLSSACWSYQMLERAALRARSMREASEAQVIMVAALDSDPLPDQVQRWLNSSLQQQRTGRAVLAALHEDGPPAAGCTEGRLCSRLHQLAHRWRTQFLCNEDLGRLVDRGLAGWLVDQGRHAMNLHSMVDDQDCCSSHFGGINE